MVVAAPLWAESTTPTGSSSAAATESDDELPPILVTAQKRIERLEDVPISVSVVSGESLARGGARDPLALSQSVPSLDITNSVFDATITIRGFGSQPNLAFDQAVGVFLDDLYVGRVRYLRAPFLDIERVEVLEGPQGILFGRNTIAGAMTIITANPTSTAGGYVLSDYNFDLQGKSFTGAYSVSITDTVGIRVAAGYHEDNGFLRNTFTGREEPATRDLTGRITLQARPTNGFSATLKLECSKFDVTGSPTKLSTVTPTLLMLITALDPATENEQSLQKSAGGLLPQGEFDDTTSTIANARLEWEMQNLTITSLTGFARYHSSHAIDADFSPLSFFSLEFPDEKYDQFSQELRFTTPKERMLSAIGGIYLEDNTYRVNPLTNVNGSAVAAVLPVLNPVQTSIATLFHQNGRDYSAFGEGTWRFARELALTAGLRWNHESKDATLTNRLDRLDPSGSSLVPLVNPLARTLAGLALGYADTNAAGTESVDKLSPAANLTWKRGHSLLYASFSQGYKMGGFNESITAPPTANAPFTFYPEKANAYEVGAKFDFNHLAELNVDLFRTDYSNLQTTSYNGTAYVVRNAAAARSQGIEAQGRWRTSRWLTLAASTTYLHAFYTSYPNAACDAALGPICSDVGGFLTQNLTGKTLVRAPRLRFSGSAEVNHPLTSNLALTGRVSGDYTSFQELTTDEDPRDAQRAFWKVDMRLGIASESGRWEVALVGRNLTNTLTAGFSSDESGFTGAHWRDVSQPRNFALQAKYSF
jgi:iron complex outermembrane receptor protein